MSIIKKKIIELVDYYHESNSRYPSWIELGRDEYNELRNDINCRGGINIDVNSDNISFYGINIKRVEAKSHIAVFG